MTSKTPRSRIKGMLRQIFLKSNERAECMKLANYTCRCGKKKSVKKGMEVKINVHHKKGISCWEQIIDMIYEQILCDPEDLEVLCVECHYEEHHGN